MNEVWLYTIASVMGVSLLSLVGVFTLYIKKDILSKALVFLVSFSAGALLGDAFVHLLPEAVEKTGFNLQVSLSLLSGIVTFFVLEKFIHWHHCHDISCEHQHKSYAYMNLIGDGVHNIIDGMIIAGSFMADVTLGISTTLAVAFHEIPQELGDYAVLVHGGFDRLKALSFNFLSAILAVMGAVFTLIVGSAVENLALYLVPFTAGGFIYIASSDLIPELHKENRLKVSTVQLIGILSGIGVMVALL